MTEKKTKYRSPETEFEQATKRKYDAVFRIGDLEEATRVLHMIVDRACRKRHKGLVEEARQKDMTFRVGDRITWAEGSRQGGFTPQIFEGECIEEYKDFFLMRLKSGAARTIQKKSDYEVLDLESGEGQRMKSTGGVKEGVSDEE